MSQELQVLRCYHCEMYQVQMVKKVPKWECKMCGEKQSVKKVYFTGTGKECRETVQELNLKKLHVSQHTEEPVSQSIQISEQRDENSQATNKWDMFMAAEEEINESDGDFESSNYTFERPVNKRKRSSARKSESNGKKFEKVVVDNDVKENQREESFQVDFTHSIENKNSTTVVQKIEKSNKWSCFVKTSGNINKEPKLNNSVVNSIFNNEEDIDYVLDIK